MYIWRVCLALKPLELATYFLYFLDNAVDCRDPWSIVYIKILFGFEVRKNRNRVRMEPMGSVPN